MPESEYDRIKSTEPTSEERCESCECMPSEQERNCYRFGGCDFGCHDNNERPKEGDLCCDCGKAFRIDPNGHALCACSSSADAMAESFRRLKDLLK